MACFDAGAAPMSMSDATTRGCRDWHPAESAGCISRRVTDDPPGAAGVDRGAVRGARARAAGEAASAIAVEADPLRRGATQRSAKRGPTRSERRAVRRHKGSRAAPSHRGEDATKRRTTNRLRNRRVYPLVRDPHLPRPRAKIRWGWSNPPNSRGRIRSIPPSTGSVKRPIPRWKR